MVFAIKAAFAYLIPDVPTKIVVQLQRERYLARQAVLRGSDEQSNPSTRPRASSGEDTDAVAYQTGKEALDGQELEPSSA